MARRGRGPLEGVTPSDLDDPEVQDWMYQQRMQSLMVNRVPRESRRKKRRQLMVPNKSLPLLDDIPEVLKGVV